MSETSVFVGIDFDVSVELYSKIKIHRIRNQVRQQFSFPTRNLSDCFKITLLAGFFVSQTRGGRHGGRGGGARRLMKSEVSFKGIIIKAFRDFLL